MNSSTSVRLVAVLVATFGSGTSSLTAQTQSPAPSTIMRLTIGDVLGRADSTSERVAIARARIGGAEGRRVQARSGWLPQLSGSAAYTRTLSSQFEGFQGGGSPDSLNGPMPLPPENCIRFTPNPTLSTGERLDLLDRGLDCTANGNGDIDFSSLPFGQANQWSFGLNLQQTIFDRSLSARVAGARASETASEAAFSSERIGSLIEAAEAYYNALLAERLAVIADSTMAQAERTHRDTELAFRVGNAAEFDLLRATVARDNQRPEVVERHTDRDVAMNRLKQLLELEPTVVLELATDLTDTTAIRLPGFAARVASSGDTSIGSRAVVRAAGAEVDVAAAQEAATRGQRWPTVQLTSAYSQLTFPDQVFRWKEFLTDWNVAVRVSVPLFTGGRIRGQVMEARAAAEESRLRLSRVRKQAAIEQFEVQDRLVAASAKWRASEATAGQAERAYRIAEIRVREGISTLTDLSEVRLQLEQAEANRARAARDLQLARLRALLLRDLPIGAGSGATPGAF